jgi:hypothetical protein
MLIAKSIAEEETMENMDEQMISRILSQIRIKGGQKKVSLIFLEHSK